MRIYQMLVDRDESSLLVRSLGAEDAGSHGIKRPEAEPVPDASASGHGAPQGPPSHPQPGYGAPQAPPSHPQPGYGAQQGPPSHPQPGYGAPQGPPSHPQPGYGAPQAPPPVTVTPMGINGPNFVFSSPYQPGYVPRAVGQVVVPLFYNGQWTSGQITVAISKVEPRAGGQCVCWCVVREDEEKINTLNRLLG